LEIVGPSDNPPEYLTMSCERQRNGDQIDNAFVFTQTYLMAFVPCISFHHCCMELKWIGDSPWQRNVSKAGEIFSKVA